MKLTEFKAWFEGYTENITGQPTKKQWERIKERIAEIDGETIVTEKIVERYRDTWGRPYYPWVTPYFYGTGGITDNSVSLDNNTVLSNTLELEFCHDLGKHEAQIN